MSGPEAELQRSQLVNLEFLSNSGVLEKQPHEKFGPQRSSRAAEWVEGRQNWR